MKLYIPRGFTYISTWLDVGLRKLILHAKAMCKAYISYRTEQKYYEHMH